MKGQFRFMVPLGTTFGNYSMFHQSDANLLLLLSCNFHIDLCIRLRCISAEFIHFLSWQIEKSFWMQANTRRIEIDVSRLNEQFSVKDPGTFGAPEPNNAQHIMLNQKIAHNFSESV